MKTHQREILIYYNPASSGDRKTVAHAKGLTRHLKSYPFAKAPSTGTSWRTILQALDKHPKELMNKAHPFYQNHIRGREFDDEGWINVIQRNPEILLAPIAIRGRQAILCKTATDIYKLAQRRPHEA